MTDPAHPHLLPWYVAGTLGEAEAREVREHLDGCAECRQAAEGLAEVAATLSRDSDASHVGVDDLIRYGASGRDDDPALGQRVETHLLRCTHCQDDLASLLRIPSGDDPAREISDVQPKFIGGEAPSWLRQRWRLVGSLAAVALVVVLVTELRNRRTPPAEVIFSPPRRGVTTVPQLTASGPWSLKVMLPFSAPKGDYRTRVESVDGSVVSRGDRPVPASPAGALTITLPSIDRPGSYRLVLEPLEAPSDAVFAYPFQVVGASPSG